MLRPLLATLILSVSLTAPALAQTQAPSTANPAAAAPTRSDAAALGAIRSANIFEVKPDASEAPGYAQQTNAERARVQPGNNAPFWRQVNSGQPGYSSLPKSQAPEAGVLIQPFVQYPGSMYTTAGEAWRQVRNQWLIPYGGSLLVIVLVAILLYHLVKGGMKLKGAPTGRTIERFTYFERAAHWVNATAFVILALSGIVMAFGQFVLLPVFGLQLFGWLTWLLKTTHNFVGPLFAVSLLVVFLTFLKDNFPRRIDWLWLRKGGGLFNDAHVPSHRFNAGEKIVFWGGVLFLGFIVIGSGLVLDKLIPGFGDTRGEMQVAHMFHATAAMLMMAMFFGHIYLGTIGMRGAFRAMSTGQVDETWAREHHELWYDDIRNGRIPAQRSGTGGPASETPARPARA